MSSQSEPPLLATIETIPEFMNNLRRQFNPRTSGLTPLEAREAAGLLINTLESRGRLGPDVHDRAQSLVQEAFPLSGGKRKSRRSKKSSNRKRNATRHRHARN